MGCNKSSRISKIYSLIEHDNITKVEKELQKSNLFTKQEFEDLCRISIENKNLKIPILLINKGMSPDIYINDKPLSFYFIEYGTDEDFYELIKYNINLDLKDNSKHLNIAEYAIQYDKRNSFNAVISEMSKKDDNSYTSKMLEILRFVLRDKKNDYVKIIIDNVNFNKDLKELCKEYFSVLLNSKVSCDLLSDFLNKNVNVLLLNDDLLYYVLTNFSYLEKCNFHFFDYPLIINNKSEYFADNFLDGEPEGLEQLLNLINSDEKIQFNDDFVSIKYILNYRIRLLSGAVDGDKKIKKLNQVEIEKLEKLIHDF